MGGPRHFSGDPYNPIWNGTIRATPGTGFVTSFSGDNVATGAAFGLTVNRNTFLGIFIGTNFAGGTCSNFGGYKITDSLGNTWTKLTAFTNFANNGWYTITTFAGADTVTLGTVSGSCTSNTWRMDQYNAATGIGNVGQDYQNILSGTSGSDSLTISLSSQFSIVWEPFLMSNNACPTITAGGSQGLRSSFTCQGVNEAGSSFDQTFQNQITQSKTQKINWATNCNSGFCQFAHAIVEITGTASHCPAGYQCLNSQSAGNDIQLNANSTFAGEMLTNSSADLSLLASKQGLFYENWENLSIITQPFGWYLTVNGTLPNSQNYNPLFDQSVTMALVAYPVTQDAYLFMQRTVGQQLLPASGVGSDSFPICPNNSVLYLCVHFNNLGGGFKALIAALNFTGAQSGVQGSGLSYLCYNTAFTSNLFTFGSNVLNQNYCSNTNTLPWLNIQNSYYVGFWSSAGQPAAVLFASTIGSSIFAENANVIYYWIPNPSIAAQTTEGGFFGWVGRSLGGAFNAVGSAISPIINPIIGFGNSLLSVVISGLSQVFFYLVKGFQIVFNFMGGLIGLPGLGTNIVNFLTGIGAFILNVLAGVITLIGGATTGFVGFFSALATIFGSFFTNIFNNVIGFFTGTLVGWAVIAWGAINSFFSQTGLTGGYLLMIDYLFGLMELWFNGIPGWMRWIKWNEIIFIKLFHGAYWVADHTWDFLIRIKDLLSGYL